jgi:type IV secretory pathway VirJ component
METYYAVHWTHGVAMLVGFGLGAAVFTAMYANLMFKVKRTLERKQQ